MNSYFDLVGGFVTKFVNRRNVPALKAALNELAFNVFSFDCSSVKGQSDLFEQIYHALSLGEYGPRIPTGRDSLSDYLWQKIMFGNMTKVALILTSPLPVLTDNIELLFQFAETGIRLEQAVCQTREVEKEPPLRLRIFLET
jgi:hypothetical protein